MPNRHSRIALALWTLSACAPPPSMPPPEDVVLADRSAVVDSGVAPDATTFADVVTDAPSDGAADYPAGPYGSNVGATLANLSLEGFVNNSRAERSTRSPFVPYSFAALRAEGARYAIVHTSGFL